MVISRHVILRSLYLVISFFSAFLAYKYFHVALPSVDMNITMSRSDAIASGEFIAQEMGRSVEGDHVAVEFNADFELQSFVELEAGGKTAFFDMIQSGDYYPFQWHVRFFRENSIPESHVWYSPDGKKIGYKRIFPEDEKIESLSKSRAQYLVEQEALNWIDNFCKYKLVEYDSEERDCGRVDHSFVYERSDVSLGKGFYRVKLQVVGNQVSGILPFVKIPDNFTRRYHEMRSDNTLLTYVSHFLYRFLYLFLFGLLGFVFLYRRRWLLWKQAVIATLVVVGLHSLVGVNNLPLAWMSYNTVQTFFSFMATQWFMILTSFLMYFGMTLLPLVVAESAGRFTFPSHLQFWKIFNKKALSSYDVLWQVIYGYCFAMLMMGHVVLFYYASAYYWGWWSPIENLMDPNILATPLPWLRGFGNALFAGFSEEVIFRALPLSVILLMAGKSKHKWAWFVVAFILQIVLFGACHAWYPAQPFYFRVVELILPSIGLGFLYYFFGLLPGVVAHYLYDMLLMSLPIFVSDFTLQKVIAYALLALPLIVVVLAIVYQKTVSYLADSYFAKSWKAPAENKKTVFVSVQENNIPEMNKKVMLLLGVLCIGFIGLFSKLSLETKQLSTTKAEAIATAKMEIEKEFGKLSDDWQPLTYVQNMSSTSPSRFVWQEYGKEGYDKLQGSYVNDPAWIVRFVNFNSSVEDRKEEFKAVLAADRELISVTHILPEHFEGADISDNAAKKVAYGWLRAKDETTIADVKLISQDSSKLDNRRDWELVFQDLRNSVLLPDHEKKGQAKILIKIAGDKVVSYERSVYPPEEWTRQDTSQLMYHGMVKMYLMMLMFLLLSVGFCCAVYRLKSIKEYSYVMLKAGCFIGVVIFFNVVGGISDLTASVWTSQPFYNQLIQLIIASMFNIQWSILLFAVIITAGILSFARSKKPVLLDDIQIIISLITSVLAVGALILFVNPSLEPMTSHYLIANSPIAQVYLISLLLKTFYMFYALFISMYLCINLLDGKTGLSRFMQILIAIVFCTTLTALGTDASVSIMILHGCLLGGMMYGLYYLILQYDMSYLPFIVFGMCAGGRASDIISQAYPHAVIYNVIAIIVVGCVAVVMRRLSYCK